MQVKAESASNVPAAGETCMNYLKNGDYMIVKAGPESLFTTKGHYIMVYRDPNDPEGIVRVMDSYSQNFTNEKLHYKYLNGFNINEVLKGANAYWVVSSEFRDDGYDYTACPEVKETFDERLIIPRNFYPGNRKDWMEFESNGDKVERLVLNENAPIQYPKKEN